MQITSAQAQLVLGFFEEASKDNTSLADYPHPVGFEKNVSQLEVIGKLGVIGRRLINALLLHAVHQGAPYKSYEIRTDYLRWLANIDDGNTKYLSTGTQNLMQVVVQVMFLDAEGQEEGYRQVHLLEDVYLPRRAKHLRYKLPDWQTERLFASGDKYSLVLNLFNRLDTEPAQILYEHVLAYRSEGETPWIPVEDLRRKLNDPMIREYKYFKRDGLLPAMRIVSEQTDLVVELDERRQSRSVAFVRFIIREKESPQRRPPLNQDIFITLTDDIGLSDKDISKISLAYSLDQLQEAIRVFKWNRYQGKVTHPARFFMAALDEGYRLNKEQRHQLDRYLAREAGEAIEGEHAAVVAEQKRIQKKDSASFEEFINTLTEPVYQVLLEDLKMLPGADAIRDIADKMTFPLQTENRLFLSFLKSAAIKQQLWQE